MLGKLKTLAPFRELKCFYIFPFKPSGQYKWNENRKWLDDRIKEECIFLIMPDQQSGIFGRETDYIFGRSDAMARVLSAAQKDLLAGKAFELGHPLTEDEITAVLAGRPCGGCAAKREKVMKELKKGKKTTKEVQS